MNIENFEKRAQSEFENFRPEVDTEQIWQNIEPHLKKKKKRRLFILFFWGLGLGLLLFSLLKWNLPENNAQAQHAALAAKTIHPPELTQDRNEAPSMQNATENTVSAQRKMPHPSGNSTQPKMTTIQPLKSIDKMVENSALSTFSAGKSSPESVAAMEQTIVPNSQTPLQSEATTVLSAQAKEIPVTAPFVATNQNEARSEVNPAEGSQSAKPATLKNGNRTPEKKNPAKAKKPAKIKPHKRKPSKQTLAVHTGIALPIGILKQNNLVEPNATLLANRKSSEKSLEALTADLRYAYATKKGLMFLIGMDYKRLNEKFKVSYSEKETKIITGVLTQTVDATGQIVAQTTGTKEVTTTRIYSNIAYNQYQYLNVPIGMGYQRFNKKSQWEITGGLDLSLWFRFKGTHYNAYGTPEVLGTSSNDYKRNAGMGLWASYGYSRNLSRNIRWQLSAKASIPFSNITSAEYALTQKFYTIGLQGGLIFNLVEEPKSKHKKRK